MKVSSTSENESLIQFITDDASGLLQGEHFDWDICENLEPDNEFFSNKNEKFKIFVNNFANASVFAPESFDQIAKLISLLQTTVKSLVNANNNSSNKLKRTKERLRKIFYVAQQQKEQIKSLKGKLNPKGSQDNKTTKTNDKNSRNKNNRSSSCTLNKRNYPYTKTTSYYNTGKFADDATAAILQETMDQAEEVTRMANARMNKWINKQINHLERKIENKTQDYSSSSTDSLESSESPFAIEDIPFNEYSDKESDLVLEDSLSRTKGSELGIIAHESSSVEERHSYTCNYRVKDKLYETKDIECKKLSQTENKRSRKERRERNKRKIVNIDGVVIGKTNLNRTRRMKN